MKHVQLVLALAALSATPGFSQTADTVSATAAAVAHVYVQTTKGVMAYAADATGKLTLVSGSPFSVSGEMEDTNGKYLLSVGTTLLHTYPIASNGAIGQQISQIDSSSYGSGCTDTGGLGSLLDHTGKYLYLQDCGTWQTYQLESNGFLQYLGDMDGNTTSTVPTTSSNDKFAYGVIPTLEVRAPDNPLSVFSKSSNGVFEINSSFSETDPQTNPDRQWTWSAVFAQADPNGHLAVLLFANDEYGDSSSNQLASYTINPSTGAISSTNTYSNMPYPEENSLTITMNMSPSGELLAVAGYPGLDIFHFNGAAPITHYSGTLLPSIDIDQVKWDQNNHLYALSYDSSELYVYTVTPTSIKAAPGSPYHLKNAPYGVIGLVVTP
jgi:hypothetical protein